MNSDVEYAQAAIHDMIDLVKQLGDKLDSLSNNSCISRSEFDELCEVFNNLEFQVKHVNLTY